MVGKVLDTITRGQEKDLLRFGNAPATEIIALENESELDDYTYSVAGCVGEFWTQMCQVHLFSQAAIDGSQMLSDGIRFGKGLQLVNILRDISRDLRLGRCYIPASLLMEQGLAPRDLLEAGAMGQFRGIYQRLLQQARGHLAAGWRYTNCIPKSHVRVRLACAWPILIGMRTIQHLAAGNVLDDSLRIMMPQAEVYRMIFRSIITYPFSASWSRQFET